MVTLPPTITVVFNMDPSNSSFLDIIITIIRLSFHMRDYEKDGPRVGEQRSLCKFPEARHNSSTHQSLPPLRSPGTYRKLVWCWRWGWRRWWGWWWRCLKFVEENGEHAAALQFCNEMQWVSVQYGVKERGTLGVAIERPTVDSIFMAKGFSRLLRNTFKVTAISSAVVWWCLSL